MRRNADHSGPAGGLGCQAVLFDFHETLVQLRPSTMQVLGRELGVSVGRCRHAMPILDEHIAQLREEGRWPPPPDLRWERVYGLLLELLEVEGDPAAVARAISAHFRDPAAYLLFPEVPDVLRALRQTGRKVGIVSNTDTDLWAILDHLELAEYVDIAIALGAHGLEKPEAAAFQMGLNELQVAAEHAWFVGDSLQEDTKAAAVGMTPVLIDRQDANPAVDHLHRITSLTALSDLVG